MIDVTAPRIGTQPRPEDFSLSLSQLIFLEIGFYDTSSPILRELDRFKNRDPELNKGEREEEKEIGMLSAVVCEEKKGELA